MFRKKVDEKEEKMRREGRDRRICVQEEG